MTQMGIFQKIYPGVCVGIVDSKHKNKQTCSNGDSVIEFQCSGKLFQSNQYIRDEAQGFSTGETIRVKVNFEDGIIIWEADGEFRCMHQSKKIKDKDIDWRPYIFMRDKGDAIDWVL